MAELVTVAQAAATFNIPSWRITAYCRAGELASARKGRGPSPGQACWWLDLAELRALLRKNPARTSEQARSGQWSPRYRPAPPGEPTELQYDVLAGEWWHDLLDMQLRDDGSLWTKWSDGERFVILPDGDTEHYRYVWVGARWHDHVRRLNTQQEDQREQERQRTDRDRERAGCDLVGVAER